MSRQVRHVLLNTKTHLLMLESITVDIWEVFFVFWSDFGSIFVDRPFVRQDTGGRIVEAICVFVFRGTCGVGTLLTQVVGWCGWVWFVVLRFWVGVGLRGWGWVGSGGSRLRK